MWSRMLKHGVKSSTLVHTYEGHQIRKISESYELFFEHLITTFAVCVLLMLWSQRTLTPMLAKDFTPIHPKISANREPAATSLLSMCFKIVKKMQRQHSRSGGTVHNGVGNQLAAGWTTRIEWGYNSSVWQLPTQKAKTRWATSTTSSGLAIGHVFDSSSKATDACEGAELGGYHIDRCKFTDANQNCLIDNQPAKVSRSFFSLAFTSADD